MKSHQCKNYGTYLITKIKTLSIRKIFLEVSSLNKAAIKFYEKNGFKIIGVRPNYYTLKDNSKVDAIRLLYEAFNKNVTVLHHKLLSSIL